MLLYQASLPVFFPEFFTQCPLLHALYPFNPQSSFRNPQSKP